jgi:hypothetical protein
VTVTHEERFWANVSPEPNTGCWLWMASVDRDGYGRFRIGTEDIAHRAARALLVGPIPDGLVVDHLCRVRSCVNPAHLRVCTPLENTTAPGSRAHGRNAGRDACPAGHVDRWYRRKDGTGRFCAECCRVAERRRRAGALGKGGRP